ncbi:MAG: gliding motility protein GldL [Bacteroidia bacterium]
MTKKVKGKLNAITFIYGFGAAVILIASMFKFIGWDYANELFVFGLSIEATIFMISAFERSTPDKDYNWENVFPQLMANKELTEDMNKGYQEAMIQFSETLSSLSKQMNDFNTSLGTIKTEMAESASSSKMMHSNVEEFNKQIDEYNKNMKIINSKYQEFITKGNV